jgi:hypothetical protein
MAMLLGSCGSGSEKAAPDADESAAGANRPAAATNPSATGGDAVSLRAGAWVAEVSLVSVDSPDIAPEAFDALKADLMATYSGHDSCLKPDQIDRPPQQFFSGSAEGCVYDRLQLANGEIGAAMTCQPLPADGAGGGDPRTHRIEFRGTYTTDSYSLQSEQVVENADRSRRISFVLSTQGRRVGDC